MLITLLCLPNSTAVCFKFETAIELLDAVSTDWELTFSTSNTEVDHCVRL